MEYGVHKEYIRVLSKIWVAWNILWLIQLSYSIYPNGCELGMSDHGSQRGIGGTLKSEPNWGSLYSPCMYIYIYPQMKLSLPYIPE